MLHRLNYNIDRDWQVSGEYRILTQVEAQDSKQGFLVEASRKINDNSKLGIGWNFTTFNDDLTDLGYTAQGPFLRLTAQLYDRTPEEIERARKRRLEEKINLWAWDMINKELARPESPIVAELNRYFTLAQAAHDSGNIEQAQEIYKDIIVAGQMMFEEASGYIHGQISLEEKWKAEHDLATEYFKKGQLIEAKKIWEKIIEEAEKDMLK